MTNGTEDSCLPDTTQDHAVELLKAVGNDARLSILRLLAKTQVELSVTDINTQVGISQSALSQHLGVLRAAQLVSTRRQSQTIFYRIADHRVPELIALLGLESH